MVLEVLWKSFERMGPSRAPASELCRVLTDTLKTNLQAWRPAGFRLLPGRPANLEPCLSQISQNFMSLIVPPFNQINSNKENEYKSRKVMSFRVFDSDVLSVSDPRSGLFPTWASYLKSDLGVVSIPILCLLLFLLPQSC